MFDSILVSPTGGSSKLKFREWLRVDNGIYFFDILKALVQVDVIIDRLQLSESCHFSGEP